MNKNLNYLIAGILVVVIIFVVNNFFTKENNNSAETRTEKVVRMGSFSTAIDYAPYLLAKQSGDFEKVAEKYKAKVEYTTFQSLPPINEALAAKKIDMLFYAEPPAIIGKAAGMDIKIIGEQAKVNISIIVPKNSKINKVSDLKNKKIGVLAGTSVHQGLVELLSKNNLSVSDVKIIDMLPTDAKAAFLVGQIDAWYIWPPFAQQEILAGTAKEIPNTSIPIHSIIITRSEFLNENEEFTKELLGVIKKYQNFATNNPDESQTILATELNLPKEVIALAWPLHNFQQKLDNTVIQDIQNKANFLLENKFIKNFVEVSQMVVNL